MIVELEPDRLTQIRQIMGVAELAKIHIVPWLEVWGNQVRMTICWNVITPVTFAAKTGLSPASMSAITGDTFALSFDFAPLHIVKWLLEEYSDKCVFESAHEKAEVLRVYGTPA